MVTMKNNGQHGEHARAHHSHASNGRKAIHTPQKKNGEAAAKTHHHHHHHLASKSSGKKAHGHAHHVHAHHHHQVGHQAKKNLHFTPQKPQPAQSKTPTMRMSQTPPRSTPSPKIFAGSKCYEPPTPESLPKPPKAWTGTTAAAVPATSCSFQDLVANMQRLEEDGDLMASRDDEQTVAKHLKFLLNVQA